MYHVVEPDYCIRIGIKDRKVVSIDYAGIVDNETDGKELTTNYSIKRRMVKYLREAIKFIHRGK